MRQVIGLIPAAGEARRLGRLPCSKEIFPVGFRPTPEGRRARPVCGFLLESFHRADIAKALILLRKGKWDVPELLGDGRDHGVDLAYLALEPTASVPETLDRAFPFVADATVALGFPDTWFEPADAFVHLLKALEESDAEVVLGCVPSDRSEKTDMVEFDARGRVRRIVVKQTDTGLLYAWVIAAWTPAFTRFLHDFVAGPARQDHEREPHPGHVIQAAVDGGMRVDAVAFPGGHFLDIGTPEDLDRALRRFAGN